MSNIEDGRRRRQPVILGHSMGYRRDYISTPGPDLWQAASKELHKHDYSFNGF